MNQALSRAILIDEAAAGAQTIEQDDGGFGFQDLLAIFLSQRFLMLAVFALTALCGGVYILTQKPVFFTEAQIGLGPRQGDDVSKNASAQSGAPPPDNAVIESEMQILKSNDLMNRLITQLHPEILAAALQAPSPTSFKGANPSTAKWRELVQNLQGRLSVKRQQTSNVIAVGFNSPTPATAVLLANALVSAYLEAKIDERLQAATRAGEWLTSRVDDLAKEVKKKEDVVAAYRAEMKLISVDGATGTEQQFFKLQDEVVASRADLAGKQARLAQIQDIAARGGRGDGVLEAVNSPTIQGLRQREAEIAGREVELKQRYFDSHPDVQRVEQEHQAVLQQITAELERIKASQSNEVNVARSRLRELESNLAKLENSLVNGNRAIVKLRDLERDAAASSSVYKDLMLRSREIADQESLKVVDARSVSRAIAPSAPSSTSPKIWIAFFLVAGALLAAVAAILRAMINDRILRPETVARRFGVPALVSVPMIRQRQLSKLPLDERTPENYLVNHPMTSFAEALRVLTADLMADVKGGKCLTVAITSALAAEGKTTVSLSLGRAAAMSGLRVLIVDCDARRPSLSARVADHPSLSLTNVMKDGVPWKQAAVPDPLTSALVLPINANDGDAKALFRPDAVRRLLDDVTPQFDLIVLDCAPVLAVAETRWLTSVADLTVVVARWNQTRASAVRTAVREIFRAKGRVAGVVLNRLDVGMTRKFSHSDSLYYGGAGKGYYTT